MPEMELEILIEVATYLLREVQNLHSKENNC